MEFNLSYLLYGIVIAIVIIGFFIFKRSNKGISKQEWLDSLEFTTLRIDVPRNNDKSPLAAEQMFAALHGIFSDISKFQYHLSFEIVARSKSIQFYTYVPKHLKEFVEGQIYAQYPTVEIREVSDYAVEFNRAGINFSMCELGLNKPDVYPIKQFTDFEVDPISGITSVITNLQENEQVWFQILVRPVGDEWQDKGNKAIAKIKGGDKSYSIAKELKNGFAGLLKQALLDIVSPGKTPGVAAEKVVELPGTVQEALKHIETKITKLGYETKLRILATSLDPSSAKIRSENMAAAFKQYNTTNLNGFRIKTSSVNNIDDWHQYLTRNFESSGNIMNISELASIYHFPHENVSTPNIVWSGAKRSEPPSNLPTYDNTPQSELTVIGETNFRNTFKQFGIKMDDRRRHMYLVGKSGVGKSVLIENMAFDDLNEGRGIVIVDPHGELADKVLACVPDNRVEDIVVFDPADREYPIAFNLLESVGDDFKGIVASGFVGIFKKIFGDSWGPRLEHILRNTVLALLDYPDSTMLDIPRMLTGKRFREKVVTQVKDPVIKDFWLNEFEQYDSKFRTEAVSPILNKVGQFLASTTIRNIVGQARSRINIREIMDQKKILIVNLSRGKIGEDNSALLGAMMITKIQLAAMSRADVTVDQRPDCYLYVDEFQNFATESFAVILAEARKYNLNLTIAHQYIAQMDEKVRDAVFGNAGTIITFRVGGTDAEFLVKEYEPVFSANDLVNLEKFNIYIKLLVDGISSPAFSAQTLPPVQRLTGNYERVIALSRQKYSTPRSHVENQIEERAYSEESELQQEAEAYKSGGLEALLSKRGVEPATGADGVKSTSDLIQPNPFEKNIPDREISVSSVSQVALSPVGLEQVVPEKAAISSPQNEAENITSPIQTLPQSNTEADHAEKPDKNRLLRYQFVVGNKIYKERTARGGVKWYFAEDIDRKNMEEKGIILDENSEKAIRINELIASKLSQNPKHNNSPKQSNQHHQSTDLKNQKTSETPNVSAAFPATNEFESKPVIPINQVLPTQQTEDSVLPGTGTQALPMVEESSLMLKPEILPAVEDNNSLSNSGGSTAVALSEGEQIRLNDDQE